MIINFFLVAASFIVLIQGAKYFVKGSASIARNLGISTFVIGLTVVSVGTSAPELFVNVIAATQGATDLSIGNILGSNIADILLGLGIAGLLIPLQIKGTTVWKEIPYALLGAIIFFVFGSDFLFNGVGPNELSRTEGIALLGFFIIFIVYTFGLSKVKDEENNDIEKIGWGRSLFYTVGGVLGLVIGGKLAVDAAVAIALGLGISENLIGLTIVAVGTSLPELATALIAARAGHVDLVVGGIIGTVIFNNLFVLGTTALVSPLPFSADSTVDALVWVVAVVLIFLFMFIGKKHILERWQSILFIVFYVAYITFAIIRG